MEQRGNVLRWIALALTLASSGCGSDDDDEMNSEASSGECPSLAGTWTITMHCNGGAIGMAVHVTQGGCTLMLDGVFDGYAGSLTSNGSFNLRGPSTGPAVTCGGVATNRSITETCSPNCVVTLNR